MKHLVLGGARSGKSHYAQQLAENSGLDVVYIATAWAGDDEMRTRIVLHQQQRPAHWRLVEEREQLARALLQHDALNRLLLVDCLTLWLSNLLASHDAKLFQAERDKLFEVLPQLKGELILVSNEVGQGIVPDNALARVFVDEAGRLHQQLADVCDQVTFMIAGLPQRIKNTTRIN